MKDTKLSSTLQIHNPWLRHKVVKKLFSENFSEIILINIVLLYN